MGDCRTGRVERAVRNEFAGLLAHALEGEIANSRGVDRCGNEFVTSLLTRFEIAMLCAALLNYTIGTMHPDSAKAPDNLPVVYALRISKRLDGEEFPAKASWESAPALRFETDWKGQNADSGRATEVRLLWSPVFLFLRFHCAYRTITVFPDARADGWRDQLWDRDVAEVFLQPDSSDPLKYKEFEVGPNGYWIDLDISHGQKEELHSGLRRRVILDAKRKTWTAELALPLKSLTQYFDPQQTWRVNFYRVEGEKEPRFYSAWSPTHSPQPNFHVPAAFGSLVFRKKA